MTRRELFKSLWSAPAGAVAAVSAQAPPTFAWQFSTPHCDCGYQLEIPYPHRIGSVVEVACGNPKCEGKRYRVRAWRNGE